MSVSIIRLESVKYLTDLKVQTNFDSQPNATATKTQEKCLFQGLISHKTVF